MRILSNMTCSGATALAALAAAGLLLGLVPDGAEAEDKPSAVADAKPLRGLLLTGGCCHDYGNQKEILTAGIGERVDVDWKVVQEGGTGTKHQFETLKQPGWEKGYDFVLYNICFSHEEGADYIEGITKVHEGGLPAVALHCTAHTYHWKVPTDAWEKFLGVTSPGHGRHDPITIRTVASDHPIMKPLTTEWTTPKGELYHIDKVWPDATPLAEGTIDGWKNKHVVAWTNVIGKGRVFGTTIGHHNETMATPEYLDMVARGLLWATGRLKE